MKANTTLLPAALAALLTAAPASAQDRFQQPAMLIFGPDKFEQVWIADADEKQIRYFSTARGIDSTVINWSKPESIWLYEPREYTEAVELLEARDYAAAAEAFGAVREKYSKLRELPNNHSSLAGLHQMEALRKQLKLEEMLAVEAKFLPIERESLSRGHHKRQIELVTTLWKAVHNKDWGPLALICEKLLAEQLPGYQRAQVGYCLGLAQEALKQPWKAINAYNVAFTADTAASEVLSARAAENALRLYLADEGVQLAIKLYPTPDRDEQSLGHVRLVEAASLAALYELTLGGGKPLPSQFKELLVYLPEDGETAPESGDGGEDEEEGKGGE